MANWIAITSADVDDYLVAAKADALRSAALRVGQTDTVSRVIADVVQQVRLDVASSPRNVLDSDTTKIPTSLKVVALDIIIARLHLRLQQKLTQDQVDCQKEAERKLDLVRKGDLLIEESASPEAEATAQKSGGIEVPTDASTRKATGSRLDGL